MLSNSCKVNYNLQFQTKYYLECHLIDLIVTGHKDVWRFEETLWYFEISSAASQSTCSMLTELGLLLVWKVKTFLYQKSKSTPSKYKSREFVIGHKDVWRFGETLWYFEISSAAPQSTRTMLTKLGLLFVQNVKTFYFEEVYTVIDLKYSDKI